MVYGHVKQGQSTMAEDQPRPRLGRGLAALIGDSGEETSTDRNRGQRRVPIEFLRPNPKNPRKNFAEVELEDLANSIREKGVIQPILVRNVRPDSYEIIAGERRWRAAQRASLHEVPIILIEAGDKEALEIAIIENVQRTDLNALEEACGYEQLAAEFGYSHPDLAKVIGKSRSHVANTLRLLKLPETVQKMLIEGQISAGHARALLTVADPDRLAKLIVAQGLTVRDIEKAAQSEAQKRAPESKQTSNGKGRREKDADTRALEQALADVLGLVVAIEHMGESGEVRIRYKSLEQLDALCRRLKR
jgi:ParB family chromosome partitioning protein